jgi:sialic acid synthase SpsE
MDNLVFNVDPQKKTLPALNHFYRADLQALANANNLYNLVFRYSLCVVADMQAGGTFTPDNLLAIRLGFGLSSKCYDRLLGKHIARDVKKGAPVSWGLLG